MPKPKRKPIYEKDGLTIYITDHPAKKTGKDRIWISVRQEKPKKWRVAASLSYVNAFDVRLEK